MRSARSGFARGRAAALRCGRGRGPQPGGRAGEEAAEPAEGDLFAPVTARWVVTGDVPLRGVYGEGRTLVGAVGYDEHHQLPAASLSAREIIAHVVWLYARFPLSLRMVEEMLLERGNDVSYETVRRWGIKFGPMLAHGLRRHSPRPDDVWHLDEVRIVIRGCVYWLWRAVDQHGVVVDEILQRRRDKGAARRLLLTLLRKQGWRPQRIVTDKLPSYAAAKREIAPSLEHRAHKSLNNRAENSHVPLRKRERQMQGFRSPGGLQRFVSVFSTLRNLFVLPARRRSALAARLHRLEAFTVWRQIAGLVT